jgi:hypothetical protein
VTAPGTIADHYAGNPGWPDTKSLRAPVGDLPPLTASTREHR